MYCIHCCCNTYSIYSFVFMGYSTIIINLKQNSIVLWNKGFSTPIPQLSIPLFPEVVTVTGFLRSFQRYPIHRQVWGRGARVSVCVGGECVCVCVFAHVRTRETEKTNQLPNYASSVRCMSCDQSKPRELLQSFSLQGNSVLLL